MMSLYIFHTYQTSIFLIVSEYPKHCISGPICLLRLLPSCRGHVIRRCMLAILKCFYLIWLKSSRGNNVKFLMYVFVPSELFMSMYLELSVKMAFSTSSPYRHGRTLGIRTGRNHPCLG